MAPNSNSLADFVDFGVAPALILYFWGLHEMKSFGWFAALVFAIAAALRLARFNVMIDDPNRPALAGAFFYRHASAGRRHCRAFAALSQSVDSRGSQCARRRSAFEIVYVLIVALLMASRIPHFSGKRIGRVPREYVIVVLFGVVACILLLAIFPMEMLIGLTFIYLATIPFAIRRFNAYAAEDAARQAGVAATQAAARFARAIITLVASRYCRLIAGNTPGPCVLTASASGASRRGKPSTPVHKAAFLD